MRTTIQTPTPNLSDSIHFYQQLEFTARTETSFTDGKIQIDVNPDRFARLAIKLYQKDWTGFLDTLTKEEKGIATKEGFLLSDPNGVLVYLIAEERPPLPATNSALTGNFGEICIETIAFKKTILFWQSLGYQLSGGRKQKAG